MEAIFRKLANGSDVRGAAIATKEEPQTISAGIVTFIARAFSEYLCAQMERGDLRIGVGHDSRVSAEDFKKAVFAGLSYQQPYDCGLISTPAMFQSTQLPESDFDAAIMLTASHLPFNRNGMKFFVKEGGLGHEELDEILGRAIALAEEFGDKDEKEILLADRLPIGDRQPEKIDMQGIYSRCMKDIIKKEVGGEEPLKGLHIIVDAGNGAAGFFATGILKELGADISGSQFLEPDGKFPNHVPNPEDPAAMEAIQKATVKAKADLGVIFDCDGDRGAVVFADGTAVNRNTLIALLSAIIAPAYPGSTVVTDSVTSDELAVYLEKLGLKHLRFKRGYKNVIDKGIELNGAGETCELAIETSGHGAFRENHFSDDGAYIAVKIIIKMAQLRKEGKKIESLIADLKQPAESKELRFHIKQDDFKTYGAKVLEDFKGYAEKESTFNIVEPNFEGIRIRFDDKEVQGWALLRMSLHDPVMPLNIEAKEKGGVEIIKARLNKFFTQYKDLVL